MRIRILRYKYDPCIMPNIYSYDNDSINEKFRRIAKARIEERAYNKATIYLSDRTAVLKLTKKEKGAIHYEVRSFNFSSHSQTNALAIYTLFRQSPYVKEEIKFSKNVKL